MRKGRDLEKLVEVLERVLGVNQDIVVASPKRIRDRVTGQPREFDVVISRKVGHREVSIAVECRDRIRPIGVNAVEAFYTKCSHCDVDRRVMVSTTGFRGTARTKASLLGIECVDLDKTDGFDWLRLQGIQYLKPKLKIHWQFNTGSKNSGRPFGLVDEAGNPVSERVLAESILDALGRPTITDLPETGELPFRFRVGGEGLFLQYRDDGSIKPANHAIAIGVLSYTSEFIPFEHVSMTMAGRDRPITDAALARINLGVFESTLVMMTDPEDGGVKIVMSAGPKKERIERQVESTPKRQDAENEKPRESE